MDERNKAAHPALEQQREFHHILLAAKDKNFSFTNPLPVIAQNNFAMPVQIGIANLYKGGGRLYSDLFIERGLTMAGLFPFIQRNEDGLVHTVGLSPHPNIDLAIPPVSE